MNKIIVTYIHKGQKKVGLLSTLQNKPFVHKHLHVPTAEGMKNKVRFTFSECTAENWTKAKQWLNDKHVAEAV
jgi:hypothetical protein